MSQSGDHEHEHGHPELEHDHSELDGPVTVDGSFTAGATTVTRLTATTGGAQSNAALIIGNDAGYGIYGGATFTALTAGGNHRVVAYDSATNAGTVWMNGGALNVGPQSAVLHTTTTLDGLSFRGDFLTVSRNNTMFVLNQRAGSGTMQSIRQGGSEQGRIRVTAGGTVVFEDTSDLRGKRDVRPARVERALERARSLRFATFRQVAGDDAPEAFGVIAQDAAEVAPWAVGEGTDVDGSPTGLGVDYGRLALLLFPAIEELAARIEALEGQSSPDL